MKQLAVMLSVMASLAMILILASVSCAQNSKNSIPDKAVLISLCEKAKDEVVASRALIKAYEATVAKQEAEQTLSDAEIAKVREALEQQKKALAESEAAVTIYKQALSKVTKKKNFFKSVAKGLAITAAVLTAVIVLRH